MNMYVGMMAAVLILAYFMRGDKPENKDYIWLSCLLMFVLCGLRDVYALGIDSRTSYVRIFREIGALDWSEVSGYSDSNQALPISSSSSTP